MRRLGVLGTMVWDRIYARDIRSDPVEEWGGIAYALAAASAARPQGWEIVPIVRLGRDLEEEAFRYFRTLPGLDLESGVRVVPEPNNRVELRYQDRTRRCERMSGGVGAWRWEEHHDPQVLVPREARQRRGIDVISRPDFKPDEWTRHNGIRVTTPARTVLDFAASHSFRHTRSVLRRLEAGKHISHPQLRAVLDAHPGAKGSATVRALLERGPAPTRSTLEDATLEILDRLGVPRPQINERTARREFDFTWPEHKLILEVDGPGFHGTPTTDAIDLEKEKLAREAGFTVIRAEP